MKAWQCRPLRLFYNPSGLLPQCLAAETTPLRAAFSTMQLTPESGKRYGKTAVGESKLLFRQAVSYAVTQNLYLFCLIKGAQ
jgi:hypothetical protein